MKVNKKAVDKKMEILNNFSGYENYSKDLTKVPEALKGIIDIFKEDSGNKVYEAYIHMKRLFIRAGKEDDEIHSELMLRFQKPDKKIIVSRVQFINKRKGFLTKLVRELEILARKEGYEIIELESVVTPEMLSFAKKNGFKKDEMHWIEIEYGVNWFKMINA